MSFVQLLVHLANQLEHSRSHAMLGDCSFPDGGQDGPQGSQWQAPGLQKIRVSLVLLEC